MSESAWCRDSLVVLVLNLPLLAPVPTYCQPVTAGIPLEYLRLPGHQYTHQTTSENTLVSTVAYFSLRRSFTLSRPTSPLVPVTAKLATLYARRASEDGSHTLPGESRYPRAVPTPTICTATSGAPAHQPPRSTTTTTGTRTERAAPQAPTAISSIRARQSGATRRNRDYRICLAVHAGGEGAGGEAQTVRDVAAADGMAPLVVAATRDGAGQGTQGADGQTRRGRLPVRARRIENRTLRQGGGSRLEGRAGILLVPRAAPTKQERALRLQPLPRPIRLWIGVRPLWTGVRRVLTGVQRPQRPHLHPPPTGVPPLRLCRAAGEIPQALLPQVQDSSRLIRRRRPQRRQSGAT